MMHLKDFKAAVERLGEYDEEAADELAIRWLRSKAEDCGESGKIASKALEIYEALTDG